jgi:hypothetical protein
MIGFSSQTTLAAVSCTNQGSPGAPMLCLLRALAAGLPAGPRGVVSISYSRLRWTRYRRNLRRNIRLGSTFSRLRLLSPVSVAVHGAQSGRQPAWLIRQLLSINTSSGHDRLDRRCTRGNLICIAADAVPASRQADRRLRSPAGAAREDVDVPATRRNVAGYVICADSL